MITAVRDAAGAATVGGMTCSKNPPARWKPHRGVQLLHPDSAIAGVRDARVPRQHDESLSAHVRRQSLSVADEWIGYPCAVVERPVGREPAHEGSGAIDFVESSSAPSTINDGCRASVSSKTVRTERRRVRRRHLRRLALGDGRAAALPRVGMMDGAEFRFPTAGGQARAGYRLIEMAVSWHDRLGVLRVERKPTHGVGVWAGEI